MATARDWLNTLWSASYKGFPFFYERDEIELGNDIVVHEFPGSDQNFNEDMGESARYYSGTAYVTGDTADSQAIAFITTLVSHGPGLLVLPTDGPIMVRAMRPCKRIAEKDRLGYIAFEVKFVREGAASALLSVPYLGQQSITAAAALGAAIAAVSPALFTIADVPEYVAAAAADEIVAVMAAVDVVRTSYPVDSSVSADVAAQEQAIMLAAPLLLDPAGPNTTDVANLNAVMAATTSGTVAASFTAPTTPNPTMPVNAGVIALSRAVVASITTLAGGMQPAIAQDAMASLIDLYAPSAENAQASVAAALSSNAATAAQNVLGAQQLARLAALTAWSDALIGVTYTDRPQGVTARAEAAERFEIELNNCPGAAFAQLYVAIEVLQGNVVEYLTQLITNLAPVVTVEARAQLPGLVWAWRLYQDPTREVDLVLRNSVIHPSFMPLEFVALAPGYAAPGIQTNWPAPPL